MAESDLATVFCEIFADIKIGTFAGFILLYPGKAIQFPHILE